MRDFEIVCGSMTMTAGDSRAAQRRRELCREAERTRSSKPTHAECLRLTIVGRDARTSAHRCAQALGLDHRQLARFFVATLQPDETSV
jgi:hypothetical protein